MLNCLLYGENIMRKKDKCWIPVFYPFPIWFSKAFFPQGRHETFLCGKGLTYYHTIPTFNDPKEEGFEKHCGKR